MRLVALFHEAIYWRRRAMTSFKTRTRVRLAELARLIRDFASNLALGVGEIGFGVDVFELSSEASVSVMCKRGTELGELALVRASRRFGALFSVDTRLDVLPWIFGRVFWCGKGDHALFQRVEISDETVVSSEMNKHVVGRATVCSAPSGSR